MAFVYHIPHNNKKDDDFRALSLIAVAVSAEDTGIFFHSLYSHLKPFITPGLLVLRTCFYIIC